MASPIVSNEPIKMYITNPKTGKAHPVGGVLTQEQQTSIDHATELAEDALLKNSKDTQTVNSKTAFNKPVEGVMSSGDEQHPIGEKEFVNYKKLKEIKNQLETAIKAANDALAKYPDYDKVVDTETDQTIGGKKTFSELPLVSSDPTSENQLARKGYVDIKASLTQFGRTKLSSETTSNAEDVAATPKAVKTAKDTADAAKDTADAAMPKSGGIFSGLITCNKGADFKTAPTVISQTSDLSGVDDLSDFVILNKADVERLVKRLADVENYKDELDAYPEIRFMLIGGDVNAETIKTELELETLGEALKAYEYFKLKNIKVDLVIINEEEYSYNDKLRNLIEYEIQNNQIAYMRGNMRAMIQLAKRYPELLECSLAHNDLTEGFHPAPAPASVEHRRAAPCGRTRCPLPAQ